MDLQSMTKPYIQLVAALLVLAVAPTASAQENDPLGDQLDNYWTAERDLPVLQEKLFSRDNRFGIGVYGGMLSSEPFYWYIPVGGRLSYFFSDHFGLEVGGQYMGSSSDPGPLTNETEITRFFADRLGEGFDPATDLEDRFLWRANAAIVWNPLYGKWAFGRTKLSHFDANLVLGGGAVSVLRPNFERTEATTVITPELMWGLGIHFFLGQNWILRADGRFYAYQGADTPSVRAGYEGGNDEEVEPDPSFFRRIQVPSEFLLGISYLF